MADEIKIQIPNFDTTNWFNNSGTFAPNYYTNPAYVFDGYFQNTNDLSFDTYNFNSYIPCCMPDFNQQGFNFNFSSFMSFIPQFNFGFNFSNIFANNNKTDNVSIPTPVTVQTTRLAGAEKLFETPKLTAPTVKNYGAYLGKKQTNTYKTLTEHKIPESEKDMDYWKSLGYNEEKGQALADYMFSHAKGFDGKCARNVRIGINEVLYNGQTHYDGFGDQGAWRVGMDYFSKDKDCKFKKIPVSSIDLNVDTLPAGTITIYAPGYSSGQNSKYGHIEVADGRRHAAAGGITDNIRTDVQEIWIPVG